MRVVQSRKLLRMFDSSMWSAVHLAVSKWEMECAEVDRDYFHSGCTGNAETVAGGVSRDLAGVEMVVVAVQHRDA